MSTTNAKTPAVAPDPPIIGDLETQIFIIHNAFDAMFSITEDHELRKDPDLRLVHEAANIYNFEMLFDALTRYRNRVRKWHCQDGENPSFQSLRLVGP